MPRPWKVAAWCGVEQRERWRFLYLLMPALGDRFEKWVPLWTRLERGPLGPPPRLTRPHDTTRSADQTLEGNDIIISSWGGGWSGNCCCVSNNCPHTQKVPRLTLSLCPLWPPAGPIAPVGMDFHTVPLFPSRLLFFLHLHLRLSC